MRKSFFLILAIFWVGCLPKGKEDYNLIQNVRENSISIQFINKCHDFIITKFNNRPFESCEVLAAEIASDAKLFVRKIQADRDVNDNSAVRAGTESIGCEPINETQLLCKVVLKSRQVSDLIEENFEFRLVSERQIFEMEGADGPIMTNVETPFFDFASAVVLKDGEEQKEEFKDAEEQKEEFSDFNKGGSNLGDDELDPNKGLFDEDAGDAPQNSSGGGGKGFFGCSVYGNDTDSRIEFIILLGLVALVILQHRRPD